MNQTVSGALDCFNDLPDQEREMLFETFPVWQENDGSLRGSPEVVDCRPNTVRHRLCRIENVPAVLAVS
jgi:sugar diacid utilization regulator